MKKTIRRLFIVFFTFAIWFSVIYLAGGAGDKRTYSKLYAMADENAGRVVAADTSTWKPIVGTTVSTQFLKQTDGEPTAEEAKILCIDGHKLELPCRPEDVLAIFPDVYYVSGRPFAFYNEHGVKMLRTRFDENGDMNEIRVEQGAGEIIWAGVSLNDPAIPLEEVMRRLGLSQEEDTEEQREFSWEYPMENNQRMEVVLGKPEDEMFLRIRFRAQDPEAVIENEAE